MQTIYFLLFLVSCVLFLISGVSTETRRYNLQALGLFCFALVFVLQSLQRVM
jgi:hypothetical protein